MSEPEKTFKIGNCSASVFANEIEQDGKKSLIKNVTIQRYYLDKDGNWRNTCSYGVNDLPKLILVAQKAYEYLTSKPAQE